MIPRAQLLLFLSLFCTTSSFSVLNQNINGQSLSFSRRQALLSSIAMLIPPQIAHAKEAPTPEDIRNSFDRVRRERFDPAGGVAYMQQAIDKQDFVSLLEFTKSYDQVLRKGAMGKAKKFVGDSSQATALSNSVTFDLIGINRSSRAGQEDPKSAQKYLDELKADIDAFLALEPTLE